MRRSRRSAPAQKVSGCGVWRRSSLDLLVSPGLRVVGHLADRVWEGQDAVRVYGF